MSLSRAMERYLDLEVAMLFHESVGDETGSDDTRDAMDKVWLELTQEERETLNNRETRSSQDRSQA